MTGGRALAAMYPPPVRRTWGDGLSAGHGMSGALVLGWYWLAVSVPLLAPVVALTRVDPAHLRFPLRRRASLGLALVAAAQAVCCAANLATATRGSLAVALVDLALAVTTALALVDLQRRG